MESLGWLLWDWLIHLPYLLLQPFLYLFLLLTFLIYRRQVELERSLFHIKLHSVWERWWSSVLLGILAGLIFSVLFLVTGLTLRLEDLLWVGGLALFLSFFHVRFLCLSYSGGIIGILALLAQLWNTPATWPMVGWFWQEMASIQLFPLLTLVAFLHIAEAILVGVDGDFAASPLILEGKRGQLQGGYYAERFWVLPMLLPVPFLWGWDATSQFPDSWPIWFGQDVSSFLFLPIPLIIGYSRLILARTPQQAKRLAMWELLLYSGGLLLLLMLAVWWQWFLIGAVLWTIGGHEWLHYRQQAWEWQRRPYFVQKSYGVKILAVLPQSSAQEMGLEIGELIVKVNGEAVNNRKELYAALQQQGTQVHLEVEDLNGNIKLAQATIYTGEHHQLGIITAPDEKTEFYVDWQTESLWKVIRQRWKRIQRTHQSS